MIQSLLLIDLISEGIVAVTPIFHESSQSTFTTRYFRSAIITVLSSTMTRRNVVTLIKIINLAIQVISNLLSADLSYDTNRKLTSLRDDEKN